MKIEKRIKKAKVISEADKTIDTIEMHEGLDRPALLQGRTYKIKTPGSDHAMYVTINDMVLNVGTGQEERHPYEMFINSKDVDHFQWVLAVTRLLSAAFRKGGNIKFLATEMQQVFDPKGGYFKKGRYIPSVVAEIGYILEQHLDAIGVYDKEPLAEDGYPVSAKVCSICEERSLVVISDCTHCLNCGESKSI